MNTKGIVGLGVVILLAVGGAYYFLGAAHSEGVTANTSEASSSAVMHVSLKDLMAGGSPVRCTLEATSPAPEGTFYIAGGKVRGDFITMALGKPLTSHMISDGAYTYSWVEGTASGVKTSVATTPQSNPHAPGQVVDPTHAMDYHCTQWQADETQFVAPTNVTFMDPATVLKNALKGTSPPTR